MTNEEVREVLQEQIDKYGQEYDDRGIEALKTAIKMLEQQPSDDCISRKEAINEMSNAIKRVFAEHRDIAEKAMNKLPSVTPSNDAIKEAYIKGYDYGVKDWFKSKTEPCEDCISRAKALEMLGDVPENWTDTEKEIQEVNDYRWFKSILEELPSVTPQPFINKPCISEGVCREDKIQVLDKIRAEIEFEVDHRTNMLCTEDVFEIIDKYKAESEDAE